MYHENEDEHDVATPDSDHGQIRVGIVMDIRNSAHWPRSWDEVYTRTLERIVEAERLGVQSVWVSEHHLFKDGYLPQPLTFAAAIAAKTSSIRIGTAVMLAPLRPAIQIAEEAAVVDILSGGRLELGLGAGWRFREFELYGARIDQRFSVLGERVSEIRQLWNEGTATPPPLQKPLPIWLGVRGPRSVRMTGRLGAGLLWIDHSVYTAYIKGLEEGGHSLSTAKMGGPVRVILADDPETAAPQISPAVTSWAESYRRHSFEGVESGGKEATAAAEMTKDRSAWRGRVQVRTSVPDDIDDFLCRPSDVVVLTPEDALNFFGTALAGLPVTDVMLWGGFPGMPDKLIDRHIELIGTAVAPALGAVKRFLR